jgi:hypothetical protein
MLFIVIAAGQLGKQSDFDKQYGLMQLDCWLHKV